jgi:hypothetical protein
MGRGELTYVSRLHMMKVRRVSNGEGGKGSDRVDWDVKLREY